jgi:RND family efflux transporter MFP subunit
MQNQLETTKTQLALAERNVGKAQVLSPVEGRVEKQIVVRGQYVKVGDPLFQVVALNKLRARLPFPESFSGQLRRGMPVRVSGSVDASVLSGKIDEIRPMAGVGNRAFDVFVSLDNPGVWKPGASVVGKVVLGEHPNAVVVPEQSVVIRPAGKVVYVVKGDQVEQRIVQVGVEQNGEVEILSGLQANETVVVDGAGFLTDKAAVAVKSKDKPVAAASAVSAAN